MTFITEMSIFLKLYPIFSGLYTSHFDFLMIIIDTRQLDIHYFAYFSNHPFLLHN